MSQIQVTELSVSAKYSDPKSMNINMCAYGHTGIHSKLDTCNNS